MFFIDDVNEYTNFLVKHRLTPNQFYILLLRHTTNIKSSVSFIKSLGGFAKKEVQDLLDRGYLDSFNERGEDLFHKYFATPKFYDEIFVDTDIAGEELWEAYPEYLLIDSKQWKAKTCDKDEIIEIYCRKIKYNKVLHKKAMDALEQEKKEGVRMGIEKWVRSEQWKNSTLRTKTSDYGEQEF